MYATEVLHFLVDAVRDGLSPTNRAEMHDAIAEVEKVWRKVHPASAPPEPQAEPDADAEAAKAAAAQAAKIAELEAEIAQLRGQG